MGILEEETFLVVETHSVWIIEQRKQAIHDEANGNGIFLKEFSDLKLKEYIHQTVEGA